MRSKTEYKKKGGFDGMVIHPFSQIIRRRLQVTGELGDIVLGKIYLYTGWVYLFMTWWILRNIDVCLKTDPKMVYLYLSLNTLKVYIGERVNDLARTLTTSRSSVEPGISLKLVSSRRTLFMFYFSPT